MLTPFTLDELRSGIADLAEESGIRDHNIRIEVDVSGHASMHLNPTHYPDTEMYRTGVKTDLLRGERRNPNIKMMDPKLRDAADEAIRKGGLFEVLLVDRNGLITEGSRSNVFFIKNGGVFTSPSDKVLLGVTRAKIIEIIRDLGAVLHEESVAAGSIAEYDAAFISGTSPAVMPIVRIGDAEFDVDDPLLRKIMQEYQRA
jgi:branched-chain amino acid aminotransferase